MKATLFRLDTAERLLIAGLAVVLAAGTAPADGFRNPPEGAAGLGRSGARFTRGEDPSTISHNPANLADVQELVVMPGVTIGYSSIDYTAPNGVTQESEDPWRMLPAVYAAWPLTEDGRYVAGMGLNMPYGQFTHWDENGILRYQAPYSAEMKTLNLSPTFAARLTDELFAGVSLNVMWSELDFEQFLPWAMLSGNPAAPDSRLAFEGDGWGLGATVGITWLLSERQRLAAAYHTPMSVTYEGDFEQDNLPPPAALPPMFGGLSASSDFETEIDFPAMVALAYGLQATDRLWLETYVEWIEHSSYEELDLDVGNNNPLLIAALGGTSIPQDWDDTWVFGLGGNWRLDEELTLRCGYTWLPTPVPEETMMPHLAEGDKHVLGIGVGYENERHAVDLAYAYNIAEDRTIDTPANGVNGEYEFDAHLIGISYLYSF